MKFVQEEFSNTLEIKKSKFITHICNFDKFDGMMKKLKNEHQKARHFVYAYRYLNEFEQIIENCSDDGEPKGTSGKPALKVLNGANIINTAVIIVRYFGGIKLGTGGLVKAYSDAVNLVCEDSIFLTYEKLETKVLQLKYNQLGQIDYLLNKYDIKIKDKQFNENIELILISTRERFNILEQNIPIGLRLEDEK